MNVANLPRYSRIFPDRYGSIFEKATGRESKAAPATVLPQVAKGLTVAGAA